MARRRCHPAVVGQAHQRCNLSAGAGAGGRVQFSQAQSAGCRRGAGDRGAAGAADLGRLLPFPETVDDRPGRAVLGDVLPAGGLSGQWPGDCRHLVPGTIGDAAARLPCHDVRRAGVHDSCGVRSGDLGFRQFAAVATAAGVIDSGVHIRGAAGLHPVRRRHRAVSKILCPGVSVCRPVLCDAVHRCDDGETVATVRRARRGNGRRVAAGARLVRPHGCLARRGCCVAHGVLRAGGRRQRLSTQLRAEGSDACRPAAAGAGGVRHRHAALPGAICRGDCDWPGEAVTCPGGPRIAGGVDCLAARPAGRSGPRRLFAALPVRYADGRLARRPVGAAKAAAVGDRHGRGNVCHDCPAAGVAGLRQ